MLGIRAEKVKERIWKGERKIGRMIDGWKDENAQEWSLNNQPSFPNDLWYVQFFSLSFFFRFLFSLPFSNVFFFLLMRMKKKIVSSRRVFRITLDMFLLFFLNWREWKMDFVSRKDFQMNINYWKCSHSVRPKAIGPIRPGLKTVKGFFDIFPGA